MTKILSLASIYALITSCFNSNQIKMKPETMNSPQNASTFYSFTLKTIDGKDYSFEQLKGKKVVIINTASKCGYTPQFSDWQAFHKEFGDKVIVLGFPCNQFMGQDPGSNEEIQNFCQKNYGVDFQMFDKVDVKGSDQAPLYQWLTKKEQNGWNEQVPSWNFCKYVINEQGQLTHFFASGIKPNDSEFLKAVGL